jgi:hypothetical protein
LKAEGRRGGGAGSDRRRRGTEAGERLKVEGDPDRWGRPGRERKGRGGERRWWACAVMGRVWARGGAGRRGGFGWVGFFFFFFLFFFKSISNQNFKPFLNQIFYMFSNSNSNTNFSNYFKGFSQTIFNNFSNIF